MANKILHKRSTTASAVPTAGQIELGELAMNVADGKLFMKKSDNSVVEIGAGGGGGITDIVEDTTPQLGGQLDGQTFRITNISDPSAAQDAATQSWTLSQIEAHNIVTDISPQLGGDLDVNGHTIGSANGGDIVITPDSPGTIIIGGDFDVNGNNIIGTTVTLSATNEVIIDAAGGDNEVKVTGDRTYLYGVGGPIDNIVTPPTYGLNDSLVVENATGNANLLFYSAADTGTSIKFAQDGYTWAGRLAFSHDTAAQTGSFNFTVNGSNQIFEIENDGTLNVAGTANYETLVTDDDDIPNKKYVDDNASALTLIESIAVSGNPTTISWPIETYLATYKKVIVIVNGLTFNNGLADDVKLYANPSGAAAIWITDVNTGASTGDIDTYEFEWFKIGSDGTYTGWTVYMSMSSLDSGAAGASVYDKGYETADADGVHVADMVIEGGANFAGGNIYIYGLRG